MSQLLSAFRYAALPPPAQAFRAEMREFLRTAFKPTAPQIRARYASSSARHESRIKNRDT